MKEITTEISDTWLFRILLLLVIVLALVAGLYAEELRQQKQLYGKVEDMFVRVRGELGRYETQRLIDQSYD